MSPPVLTVCDRCGLPIPKIRDKEILAITATNIRFNTSTYLTQFVLCHECKLAFENWILANHTGFNSISRVKNTAFIGKEDAL